MTELTNEQKTKRVILMTPLSHSRMTMHRRAGRKSQQSPLTARLIQIINQPISARLSHTPMSARRYKPAGPGVSSDDCIHKLPPP